MASVTPARVHLTPRSHNHKTGPMAVSTTSRDTCPARCPLRARDGALHGCYAEGGHLARHWRLVDRGALGGTWEDFCAQVATLPEGRKLRLSQAGDQPTTPEDARRMSREALRMLADARAASGNGPREGGITFGYTHHPLTEANVATMRAAREWGIVLNVSADTIEDARAVRRAHPDLPLTVLLPSDAPTPIRDPELGRIIVCPAQLAEHVTCDNCGFGEPLCARADRDYVVGFRAHGAAHRRAAAVADGRAVATDDIPLPSERGAGVAV